MDYQTVLTIWLIGVPLALAVASLVLVLYILPNQPEKEPKKTDEEQRQRDAYNKAHEAEKQRLVAIKNTLVEGHDFVWGHLPIVKCANGHKYRYGEFRFVSGHRKETTYDDVTTTTTKPSRLGAIYSGRHMYPVIQGGTTSTSTRSLPKTTTIPLYVFGCPLCRTSLYTFEPPYDNVLIDDYIFCRGEQCYHSDLESNGDKLMRERYASMQKKYESVSADTTGHWNGSDFVPIFYRNNFSRCPFNLRVDFHQLQSDRSSTEVVLDEVTGGLVGLGYSSDEARRAANRAMMSVKDKRSSSSVLKLALNILTGAD